MVRLLPWTFQRLLQLILGIVILRISVRIIQKAGLVPWDNFKESSLLFAFVGAVAVYLSFAVAAVLYERRFQILSAPAIYGAIFFVMYLVALINDLTLKIPETWLVRMLTAGVWLPLLVSGFKRDKTSEKKSHAFGLTGFLVAGLLAVWLMHSVMFSLERNLVVTRPLVDDESRLWFDASRNLAFEPFKMAHKAPYDGAGFHPFGVPYLTALPARLLGVSGDSILFFMPMGLIIGMLLFLLSIRHQRWLLLFFVSALFASFNTRGWVSELCYQLLYGDAWSMLYFLLVAFELYRMSQQSTRGISKAAVAVCIGLAALVKSPLAWVFAAFLPTYYWNIVKEKGNSLTAKWFWGLLGSLVALIPVSIWSIYQTIYHTPKVKNPVTWALLVERWMAPNVYAYQQIISLIGSEASNMAYYVMLSFVLIAMNAKSSVRHLIAPAGLIIFMLVLYGYVHYYNDRVGDFGSPMRYLMNVVLALYFLAGVSFQRIMDYLDCTIVNVWRKYLLAIVGIVLAVRALF